METLEIVGGALCLDFANTVNSRLDTKHDYLVQYSDLVEWAHRVAVLSPAQLGQLLKRAKQDPKEANKAIDAALSIRELIPVPEDFIGYNESNVPITDPSPFNHSTKIAVLDVKRKK